MQAFMVKKGLLNKSMNQEELNSFLQEESVSLVTPVDHAIGIQVDQNKTAQAPREPKKNVVKGKSKHLPSLASSSEVTVYKRAVEQAAPELDKQITDYITSVRLTTDQLPVTPRKDSSTSDELMDISDETDANSNLIADPMGAQQLNAGATVAVAGPSNKTSEKTAEEQVNQIILDAEISKAKMLQVPGRVNYNSILEMDNNYQMIDAHIDEVLKNKILNFEFIDFSKLLTKNKGLRDDDQRMEIVSRNGMTYLTLVSDKDCLQISHYGRWEQAFRIFSNILTSKYPKKATELLQYNPTIYTASTSYVWENVFAYDHEFRTHIVDF